MRIGRNDPCSCGSGRKYKKCCLNDESPARCRTEPTDTIKKKWKSIRWDKDEKQIVLSLFKENKSFEEISIAVNDYLHSLQYDVVPKRTPIAVAYQCLYLGLITVEQSESYIKEYKNKLLKDRTRGIYSAKKKVLERDGNKCVVCGSDQKLEYCHLISFRITRKNEEMNAIILCKTHHKEFDKDKIFTVKSVYNRMCSYYPEFPMKFVLDSTECGVHGKHLQIKEKAKINIANKD